MITAPLLPIPADGSLPPWVGVLFGIAALAGVIALVVQVVRYIRRNDDDD
jgi:hypothetical protein